jgi:TolB-like protein/tetratricopeptide (TPR) repeat protein
MPRLRMGALVMASWLLLAAAGCEMAMIAKPGGEEQELHGGSAGTFRARWWNYYTRAVTCAAEQRWNEAEADLKKALTRRSKDKRRARAYGMHFLDYFPHRELGVVYYHLGRNEEARQELEASLQTEKSAKAEYYLDLVRKILISKNNTDSHPPEVFLASPLQDERTNRFSFTVSGTARDDTYVKSIQVNGIAVRIDLATKEVPFQVQVPLKAGMNVIRVAAIDLSGKTTFIERTVETDWQGPLLSIDEPREGQQRQEDGLTLKGYAHDEAGIASITINGKDLPITTGPDIQFDYPITPAPPSGMVKVVATDTLGNKTHADIRLGAEASGGRLVFASLDSPGQVLSDAAGSVKEPLPLAIELRNLSDRQEVFLDQLYLEGRVRDEQAIQTLMVNGRPILRKPARNVYFSYLTALNEGENLFTIEARNSAGKTAARQVQIQRKLQRITQVGSRLSAALLPMERKGAPGLLTEGLEDAIVTELVDRSRFVIVERNRLDEVLSEQKLSSSQLAAPDTAVQVGKIVAANAVLMGTLVEKEGTLDIYLRVVDVRTSEVLAAVDVYGEDLDASVLKDLCQGLVLKLCDELPVVEGLVIEVKGERFFVDLGKKDHIKKGMRVIFYREGEPIVHPVSGETVGADSVELGEGAIRSVQEKVSDVAMIQRLGEEPIKSMHKVITR